MCTSSTATPAASGGSALGGAARKTSSGRSRLPPAASASAPTAATTPGWLATAASRRVLELAPGTVEARRVAARLRRARVTRASRRMERDDPASEQPVADLVEARRARAVPRAPPRPGKRRTLAGRYVYAPPPGSSLPERAARRRSNQRRRTGASEPRGLRDLEDRRAGRRAGARGASSRRPRVQVGDVPDSEADRRGVEGRRPRTAARAGRPPPTRSRGDLRRARSSIRVARSRAR